MVNDSSWLRILDVANRQAFGPGYEPRPGDPATVAQLLKGSLDLPPHPTWAFVAPIDWQADPFDQRNWCAQLHMLRWIDPLRRQGGTDLAARRLWLQIVDDWASSNLEPATASPWAWKDMVDAKRAGELLYGANLVDDGPSRTRHAEMLEVHGAWLAAVENLGVGNHALHQHSALFQVAVATGNNKWANIAIDRLRDYFSTNYDRDGVNIEGSPGYWEMNLKWADETAQRLQREGYASDFIENAIANSAEAIAHASRPDGRIEAIGDTISTRPSWLKSKHLQYIASDGADGEPPASTTRFYASGYLFGRSGWGETQRSPIDETFYSLVFGRADKIHGHQDGGSLTFFANGQSIIVDAGKYSYTRSDGRAYVLGRLGHNSIRIVGASYNRDAVVECNEFVSNERFDYASVIDRGYPGITIRRQVVFAKATESILVVDTIRSASRVTAESRWHIAPALNASIDGGAVRLGDSGASLVFGGRLPSIEVRHGGSPHDGGWVSERWHSIEPTDLVAARKEGTSFRFVTAIQRVPAKRRHLEPAALGESKGFVVEGPNGREIVCVGFGADDVLVAPTANAQGGSAQRPSRLSIPSEEIRHVATLARAVRDDIWTRSPIDRSKIASIKRYLDEGIDQGLAALARDVLVGASERADVIALGADPRTRIGFPLCPGVSMGRFFEGDLPIYAYKGIPARLGLEGEADCVLLFDLGEIVLPVRLRRGGTHLRVGFSGAMDRSRESLPRFERLRSLSAEGDSVLVISDPTLDLSPEMSLGWYLGTSNCDLVPRMVDVIKLVAEDLGSTEVSLFGSSGGGFAALQVATSVENAVVVVANPQTDIRRYHKRFADHAISAVFGDDGDVPPERVSVMERMSAVGVASSKVVLVVNEGDGHHQRFHAEPLLEWFRTQDDAWRLRLHRVQWGRGHVSPPASEFRAMLRLADER